jgi:hypothetical protein
MEETGDCLWYLALMARALGVGLETIADRNIAKLAARYPGKFTQAAALERNLEAERKTLEATPAAPRETPEEARYFNHGYREQKPATLSILQQIRSLMGYVENGTDCTVRFFQDDATKDFFVVVGGQKNWAPTLQQAFALAVERNK